MPSSTPEILLSILAKDNASSTIRNIDAGAQSMASNFSQALSSMSSSMQGFAQIGDNFMQRWTGKSALDNILGTSSKNETNKVLLKNMTSTDAAYEKLYETVDKTTDNSLTSMQELIPALNSMKAATGATDEEITNVTGDVANFGAAVLAQTGSVDLAQTAMMDLSKGYKGMFASLDQYGISKDALMRTGLWSGEEDDLEGYMKAVTAVTGSTDELMETNQGLDAQIQKAFSRGGKKIGNEFLPIIKDAKKGFLELDNELGGNLTASILAAAAGIDVMNSALWNVSVAAQGFRDLSGGLSVILKKLGLIEEAAEGASGALQTMGNASEVLGGASAVEGAAGIAGAADSTADIAKGASKGEKAADAGAGALGAADLLQNNKTKNRDLEEVLSEMKTSDKYLDRITDEVDNAADAEGKIFDLMNKKDAAQANIDSGVFGPEMRKQLSNQIKEYDDEMDRIIGTDLWNGVNKSKKSVSKAKEETNSLWKYYEDLTDGQEHALSNAEKVSSKLGFESKGGFGKILEEVADETDSSKKNASDLLSSLSDLKQEEDKIQWDIDYTQSGFLDKLRMRKDKGLKGNASDAFSGLKNFFKSSDEVVDIVDDASDLTKNLDKADDIVDGVEGVAELGTAMSAAGPEMEAAAAGGAAAEAGATGLAATFTGMITPLLALSAVIMIMIPIVTVIVAEAMVFIKLLAEFMKALNFDGINLDGAIKGISQVATAIAWVGVAMASMSFTSIMTGLAVITGGFLGITGPLEVAVDAIKDAGKKLSELNSVGIDKNVANNLKLISDSLMAVASAMTAITWNNIITGFSDWIAGALGFGSVTEGLEQAKNDIIQASAKLQEFSSMPVLDESVAQNIQNVCNSLASVGDAMGALRSIRDGQNWDDIIGGLLEGIFGEGLDIQEALSAVKDDIVKASAALADFQGVQDIPEGVGDKLKKVSDTLKSVGEAMNTLRKLRDDGNWDEFINWVTGGNGMDIADAISKIRSVIGTVARQLSELQKMSIVDESVPGKVNAVTNTLKAAMSAISELNNVKGTEVTANAEAIKSSVESAKTVILDAATNLSSLNEVTSIDESVSERINTVTNALKALMGSINEMNNVNGVNVDKDKITTSIANAVDVVKGAGEKFSALSETEGISEDITSKIQTVGSAIQQLSTATQNMVNVPQPPEGVGEKIHLAVEAVKTAITELNALSQSSEGVDISSILTSVTDAITQLQSTLTSMGAGFTESGSSIGTNIKTGIESGMTGLDTTVSNAVSTAIESAKPTATTYGKGLGGAATSGFKDELKLADAMTTEMGYVKTAVDNGISEAKSAAESGAKEVVQAFKNGVNVGSPGDIARTMSGEMGYTLQAITDSYHDLRNAAYTAARTIVDAFGDLSLGYEAFLDSESLDLESLQRSVSSPTTADDNRPVTIIVNEGAVQVDARNKTTQEARQIMITALESLDNVKNIDVN